MSAELDRYDRAMLTTADSIAQMLVAILGESNQREITRAEAAAIVRRSVDGFKRNYCEARRK